MNQANLYTKYKGIQTSDAKYIIENFFHLLNWNGDEENVLDIGCGDGNVTLEYLVPRLPVNFRKVIGGDVSEDMLACANNNKCKDRRIGFAHFDVAKSGIPQAFLGHFHHVFSFYCLHWIIEQSQAFKNIYDVLRPGGEALLTFLASNPIYDIYETMAKTKKWSPYMRNYKSYISPYHHLPNPDTALESLLEKQGFVIHLCRTVDRNYIFPNFTVLSKTVLAINPFIPQLPPDEVDNFIMDYIEEVRHLKSSVTIEKHCSNNNVEERIHLTYKLFIVHLSKPS